MQTGKLVSPFGTSYVGFKVTVLGSNPDVQRTQDDLDKIFKCNPDTLYVHEERKEGKFKSYSVSTDPL